MVKDFTRLVFFLCAFVCVVGIAEPTEESETTEQTEEAAPKKPENLSSILKKVLARSVFRAVFESDPTRWTPEMFEEMGLEAKDFQQAMRELEEKYPKLKERFERGRERREAYQKTLDDRSASDLESRGINRHLPAQTLASYLAFLKAQQSRQEVPPTPLEQIIRTIGGTESAMGVSYGQWDLLRQLDPWHGEQLDRTYTEKSFLQDIMTDPRTVPDGDVDSFESWKKARIEEIEKAYLQNHKEALFLAADEMRLKVQDGRSRLGRETLEKFTFSIEEGEDGRPVIKTLDEEGKPVEVTIEGEKHKSVDRVRKREKHVARDARKASLLRIQNLNDSLSVVLYELRRFDEDDKPEVLRERLQKANKVYREDGDNSKGLFVPRDKAGFFGERLYDAIWYGLTKRRWLGLRGPSPKYWHPRRLIGRPFFSMNPFIASVDQRASGKKFRPHFFKKIIPTLTALTALTLNVGLDIEEGHYDKEIAQAKQVAADVAEAAEITWEMIKDHLPSEAELEEFRASSGGLGINNQETRDAFRLGKGTHPDYFVTVTSEELEKGGFQKKAIWASPTKNITYPVTSERPQIPINGRVFIPADPNDALTAVVVTDSETGEQIKNVEVLVSDRGVPVIQLPESHRDRRVDLEGHFIDITSNDGEPVHLLAPEDLDTIIRQLSEAKFTKMAQAMKDLQNEAKRENRFLTPKEMIDASKAVSFYTYHPMGDADSSVPKGNPYYELTAFLNEKGEFCTQCNGAGKYLEVTLRTGFGDRPEMSVRRLNVLPRVNDKLTSPGHVIVEVEHPDEDLRVRYDSTPSQKDPRAPKPIPPSRLLGNLVGKYFSWGGEKTEEKKEVKIPPPRRPRAPKPEPKPQAARPETSPSQSNTEEAHSPTDDLSEEERAILERAFGGEAIENLVIRTSPEPMRPPPGYERWPQQKAYHRYRNPGDIFRAPKGELRRDWVLPGFLMLEDEVEENRNEENEEERREGDTEKPKKKTPSERNKAIQKALDGLLNHRLHKENLRNEKRDGWPSSKAYLLAKTLMGYPEVVSFEEVQEKIRKLWGRADYVPASESELAEKLDKIATDVASSLENFRKNFRPAENHREKKLANPGYASVINKVFSVISENFADPESSEDGKGLSAEECFGGLAK